MKRFPAARHDLLESALEEEVVLYDPQRKQAHSLNRVALAVWKRCDGKNSFGDLRRLASADIGLEIDEGTVWLALRRLQSARLLLEKLEAPDAYGRRELLRKAGRIGAVAVATPMIASALVPIAAAAASKPGGLPACGHEEDEPDDHEEEEGCSALNASCTCSKTTAGVRVCINPSTALKKTTCRKDSDCRAGYLCIPRGMAPPRCIAPCAVPTCVC